MDRVIQGVIAQDLTGGDVETLTRGKAELRLYDDLQHANNIFEFLGPKKAVVLLIPIKSLNDGHWVAVWEDAKMKAIHFFDPYGLTPDQEEQYSSVELVRQQLLQNMFQAAQHEGYQILYNTYRFQQMNDKVATCGRHSCVRLLFDYLDEHQYARLMGGQHENADTLVTLLTFICLDDEEKEKNIVMNAVHGPA